MLEDGPAGRIRERAEDVRFGHGPNISECLFEKQADLVAGELHEWCPSPVYRRMATLRLRSRKNSHQETGN